MPQGIPAYLTDTHLPQKNRISRGLTIMKSEKCKISQMKRYSAHNRPLNLHFLRNYFSISNGITPYYVYINAVLLWTVKRLRDSNIPRVSGVPCVILIHFSSYFMQLAEKIEFEK